MSSEELDVDIRAIARAVLAQAIEDVTLGCSMRTSENDIRDALLFLTSNRKQFYESRAVWCSIAGEEYDPQKLRQKVLQAISDGVCYKVSDFITQHPTDTGA